jgi:hypothetical protein
MAVQTKECSCFVQPFRCGVILDLRKQTDACRNEVAKHHSSGARLRFEPRLAFYGAVQKGDWRGASRRSTVFVSSDAFANSTLI